MTWEEAAQRDAVVAAAESWVGTPYHHRACVKGAGVDCAWLLIKVFSEAGVIQEFDPGFYNSGLAYLRRGEARYKQIISRFARKVERAPLSGDVILFRFINATHGGIVTNWPNVVHAFVRTGSVVKANLERDVYLGKRVDSFWTAQGWS